MWWCAFKTWELNPPWKNQRSSTNPPSTYQVCSIKSSQNHATKQVTSKSRIQNISSFWTTKEPRKTLKLQSLYHEIMFEENCKTAHLTQENQTCTTVYDKGLLWFLPLADLGIPGQALLLFDHLGAWNETHPKFKKCMNLPNFIYEDASCCSSLDT